MNTKKYLSLFLSVFLLFSCSSTKIISSWKAKGYQNKPYQNIMVWAILPEQDSTLRNQIETHLVNDLVVKGYHAVSALQVYKDKAYKKLSPNEIVNEFRSTGVDAVISLVLLNKEKEEKYYPGGYFSQPVNNYGSFDRYYSNVYERVLVPGYYITTINYYWQGNLFETNADRPVYSVQTKSFDPYSTNTLAHENSLLIIKDMVKKKIILAPSLPDEE